MRRLPVPIPHRPGCADFPLPVLHGRASLVVVYRWTIRGAGRGQRLRSAVNRRQWSRLPRSRRDSQWCEMRAPDFRMTGSSSEMASTAMTGKAALVCGAGGFIGHHLVKRLKREGFWVRGVDLKFPRFSETEADDFMIGDLRDPYFASHAIDRRFDEIYQLAADMGGAGYIFTGEHDADVMHNSASINLNIVHAAHARNN